MKKINDFAEDGLLIPENSMRKKPDKKVLKNMASHDEKVIFELNSTFHDISICESEVGRFLKYGMSIQAGIMNSPEYKGNIPYLNYFLQTKFLKKDAKKILLIGFGIGYFVKQIEQIFDNLEHFDTVDIEENIMDIAINYFDFKPSDKFHFYLQDALVFLRNNKLKYDIIIVDVAGNEGIDERFFSDDFFLNVKKSLAKNGIFAFNSFANTDFAENENTFFGFSLNRYKKHFKNFAVFDAKTSDILTFKVLYGLNERLYDITNAIFIASDMKLDAKMFENISGKDLERIKSIGIDISTYAHDLHKIYISES